MATTYLPRRIPHSIRPQCLYRPLAGSPVRRPFSSSAQMLAFSPRAKRVQLMQEDALSKESEMNDFGLLAGTVIRPPNSKLPSIISEPKDRLEYEWGYIKALFSSLVGRMYYKFWVSNHKPRPKLSRKKAKQIAREMHEEMYKAFVTNDTTLLKTLCCNGLLSTLTKATPKENEVLSWRLLSHLSRPRVVSNRASPLPLPGDPEAAVRQVIIRFHTHQRLEKWTREDAENTLPIGVAPPRNGAIASVTKQQKPVWAPKSAKKATAAATMEAQKKDDMALSEGEGGDDMGKKVVDRDVVEYVVMQVMMRAGKEQRWKIWGLAKETSLQDMRDDKRKIQEMNEWEANHPSAV